MRITDGKKTIEITMKEWEGNYWSDELSDDFFQDLEKIGWPDKVGLATDVDYCIDYANDWAERKGDFEDEEGGERMIGVEAISQIRRIRELTGLSMNKFCAKYRIPSRTLQDWEYGRNEPAEYTVDLLERAVREDFGLPRWYNVVSVSDDEWPVCGTYSRADAIREAINAWRSLSKHDKAHQHIEVRIQSDKDFEDREDWDCDLLEW